MKIVITLFFLIPGSVILAQVVDKNHFDERLMSEVIFSKMTNYSEKNEFYSLYKNSTGCQRIYRYIKKWNEKLALNELNEKINDKILSRYESRILSKTNLVVNIGLIDSVMINDSITYQEIGERCITDWLNSENFIFLNWTQVGESVVYFNNRKHVVYVFFAYLQ